MYLLYYNVYMYATEKYVKMEARELRDTINEAVSDLSGDIRFLHGLIADAQQNITLLREQIEALREEVRVKNV